MNQQQRQNAKQQAIKKLFVRAGSLAVKQEMRELVRCIAKEDPKRTVKLLQHWINQK